DRQVACVDVVEFSDLRNAALPELDDCPYCAKDDEALGKTAPMTSWICPAVAGCRAPCSDELPEGDDEDRAPNQDHRGQHNARIEIILKSRACHDRYDDDRRNDVEQDSVYPVGHGKRELTSPMSHKVVSARAS